jgi:hypothetical protein
MRKLAPVEEAKALMSEAMDWSVWRWLLEKRRVRATADRATEALGEMEKKVKAKWSEKLRRAAENGRLRNIDPELKSALKELKQAEEASEASRLDAEATFDEAERRLCASMARAGAQKAIHSWELREQVIRVAESLGRRNWCALEESEPAPPSRGRNPSAA